MRAHVEGNLCLHLLWVSSLSRISCDWPFKPTSISANHDQRSSDSSPADWLAHMEISPLPAFHVDFPSWNISEVFFFSYVLILSKSVQWSQWSCRTQGCMWLVCRANTIIAYILLPGFSSSLGVMQSKCMQLCGPLLKRGLKRSLQMGKQWDILRNGLSHRKWTEIVITPTPSTSESSDTTTLQSTPTQ